MRVIGIDWGEKRIGLAISEGSFAEPYAVVSSFEDLAKIIKEEEIGKVILGLPEGKYENRARKFGQRIERELNVPVVLRSEVLTSRQAQKKLIEAGKPRKTRSQLDAASAALLLQEYLDSNPIA